MHVLWANISNCCDSSHIINSVRDYEFLESNLNAIYIQKFYIIITKNTKTNHINMFKYYGNHEIIYCFQMSLKSHTYARNIEP